MAHVTIPSKPTLVEFIVTTPATTGPFEFDFSYFDPDDIEVYIDGVLTLDFSLAGNAVVGGYEGGSVTLDVAVTNAKVAVKRNVPILRETDFPTSGKFNINTLNSWIDRIIAICQQLFAASKRTLRLADSDADESATLTIPTRTVRAKKALIFDVDGNLVTSADDFEDAAADSAANAAAAQASADAAALDAASAEASALAAAASAAVIPAPTGQGDKFVRAASDGLSWLYLTAAEVLAAIGAQAALGFTPANRDASNAWGANQKPKTQTLTDGATVNWNAANGQQAKLSAAAARSIAAPTGLVADEWYTLHITNGSSLAHSWASIYVWGEEGTPTAWTGRATFTFYYDGTDMLCIGRKAF
jgi:hypothetical protein